MKDLIEALQIIQKYMGDKDEYAPVHCEHDVFMICCVDPELISEDDLERLDKLGFFVSCEYGDPALISYRFGSC